MPHLKLPVENIWILTCIFNYANYFQLWFTLDPSKSSICLHYIIFLPIQRDCGEYGDGETDLYMQSWKKLLRRKKQNNVIKNKTIFVGR